MKKITATFAMFAACCLTSSAQVNWGSLLRGSVNTAKEKLLLTGVGYPAATAPERAALQEAVQANEYNTRATYEDFATFEETLEAFYAATDIEQPVDGKTYTFTFVTYGNGRYYMNYADGGYELAETASTQNDSYPSTAMFTCRDLGDGTFAFFNTAGKYLAFKGQAGGANGNKGCTDAYDATANALTITKMPYASNLLPAYTIDLFGYVNLSGKDADGTAQVFTIASGSYATSDTLAFSTAATSALLIQEATSLGTTVKLNPATGIDGVDNIATFSAPFATVAPEGVSVWYVTVADDGNALMQPVEAGLAIPAGAGVILTSSATEATMLPATDETLADLEGNKLVGSGGEALQITDISGAYILTGRDGQVGFYYLLDDGNTTLAAYKAYLRVDASTQAIRMDFSGSTTGISAVEAPEQANAPIYDLSGRRVLQPEKGVYVKNGKKFIVKYPPTANTSKQEAI